MDELMELSELWCQRDLLNADIETKRKAIIAPVQAELDALAEETEPMLKSVNDKIEAAKAKAAPIILALGKTVKEFGVNAVYTPAESNDSYPKAAMKKLAETIPAVAAAKKPGVAEVNFKRV